MRTNWILAFAVISALAVALTAQTTKPSPQPATQPAAAPTTQPAVAAAPTTKPAVAAAPTTQPAVAAAPTTKPAVVAAPTTQPAVAAAPTTKPAVAAAPTTQPAVAAAPTTKPAVAAAPTTKPAVAAAPTTKPAVAAAPTTQPAVAAAPTVRPAGTYSKDSPKIFLFQFSGCPYHEVIRKFAQACKKPLLGEVEIPGSLTFFDSEPYCYEEALDTLNILLNMRGFALIEFKRYLRVVQVTELANNASILRGLDQVGDIRNEQVVTVLLPVENLDPEAASKAIVRMVSSYGSITPMPRGKGVLITDRLSSVRRIQDMIQMLDAERATASDIKTIQIKKASAKSVASVINQVLGGPSSSPERRSSSAPPASSGDSVSAYSDDRTNLLFLRGVGAKLQLAEQLVEKLDSEATSDVSDMRLIELKNARAEDVAKTISEVMPRDQIQVAGPPSSDSSRRHYPVTVAKGKVVAEPETNRLIVSAPLDVMVKIEELIKKLDVASDTSGGVKVLRLKTADAAQLAPIVSAAVAKQTLAAGGARRGMVTVTADSRTNSLVIVGPAGDIQAAEKLVAELDRPLDKEEERQIRIIQLPSGNAEKLASAISRVLDSSPSSHYGSSRYGSSSSRSQTSRPRIEADSGTNSLLISAAPSDWPQIESILKQIIPPPPPDQPAAATPLALTTPVLRHVPLKFAKAEDLATTLLSVFGTRRRSEAVSIIITPSARTNSLLISAAEPDQIAMGELIKTLDVDSSEKLDPVRIVELKVADAAKVADAIQAVLPPRPVGRRGETHQVTIHADTATNTLFIRAGEAEQKLIDEVIARMDKGAIDPTIVRETRIIALKFVPASQMAASVQQFFQSAGGSPSSPYGSSYYRRRSYSSASGEKAFDSLVVAAAPGDQALIVEGPKKKVDEVAAFVAKLDTQDTGQATIVRVYTLKEADAGEISRTLSATFSKKWQDQKRRDPKLADPEPSFEINAGANQLIIAATEKQLTEIDALIAQLEKAPAVTSQTKTFPLKHAKAEELVNVLQTMLTSGAPSPYSGYAYSRRSRSVEGELKIAAIAASNSLVIQGPPAKMAKAEQLIASFDTPQAGESSLISIVPLKAASASQLAVTLKNMLPPQSRERESELVIQADTASNSLLIRASATQRKIIDELIPKLDVELAEGTREMRVVPVMFVSASQIAQTVSQVFRGQNGTSSSSSSYRRSYYRSYDAPQAGPGSDEILITPAPNDRSIVIEAPKKKIEPIVQLIATLDVAEGTAKANQIRTYQLKNANAAEVSRVLSGMYTQRTSGYGEAPSARGGSGPTATPPKFDHDTATNQLVVSASDEQFVEIDALIKKLEEAPQLATQTKTFPLKHVRASEVLPVLTNLLSETPASTPEGYAGYSPYSSRRRYGASASSELRLAALPGANSIVAQGPPPKMLKVEQLIASFDTPQAGESSLITMVPLKNASAAKLAETLKSMLPAASRDKPSELVVQADTATNSLLIRADGTQRKMLDELILKLDVEVVQTAREMRVVPVQFVSAAQIAQTVSQVFLKQDASSSSYRRSSYYYRSYYRSYDEPEEPTRTGADADKIVVTASPNDRSVIVEAPKLKIEPVVQLITTLDVPEGTAKPQQIRTYQLKNANAAETARILSNMYAQRQNGSVSSYGEEGSPSRTAKSKIPAPKFDHDAGSNQLVISANDEQFVEIEALIKTLDETPQLATQTKTFPLKHARASEIVPLLTSLLSDTPSSPAVGSYSRYSSRSRYGASATAGEVHVATLPGTNSVIVQGPPAKLTQAEQLISTFDTPEAGGSSLVTVIPLKNASAVTLAETLRSMLPPPVRGRPEEIVIQADSLTNSLLVRAPEDQRKTIDDLIAKLDGGLADNAQTREMRIIPVKHLSAAQLAETVSVMYQQLREARRGLRARPVDPGEQVVITPSPNDRSIVVEAPKKKVEEIAKLVADLDTEENSFQILVRTYQLKTASASELARSLTNIFAAKVAGSASPGRRPGAVPNRAGPQPTFDVDAASNQLLVAATSEQLIEIEQLIQKMDNPEVQAVQTRIFPIQHAKADELVTLLQTMLNENPPSAAYGSSAYYSRRYRPTGSSSGDDIRISTLPGTNSIVVQGPPNKLTRAEQLIKSFDTPEAAVAATVTIIPIKNASAATLVETLRAMLPPVKGRAEEVFIQADILTNSVLIRAPETQRKMVTELVAKLDTQSELTREMRVIPLTFTSATQLASALQVMYQQHMATRGGPRAKPVDPAEQVIFTPAPHDQALVVEAPKKKMEEIAALIEKLDVQESPDRLTVRTYQLAENSDAVETARTLAKLFTETRVRPGAIAGNQQQPRFEADGVGNQLIIAATPKQFEEIEPLLKKLQDSAQLAVRSKTYQLKFAKAADIVQMLQSMLTGTTGRSRYSAYGDPAAASSEVRVAAVNGSNSVFVQGPPAKLAMADELIRTFDTEQAAARSVIQIIKLKNAQAASLAQAVNATLEARAARRPYGEQAGADDGKVTVTPEPNSNSLLVRGPLAEIPSVLEMIRDLDEGGTSAKSEVRIFPIKNSDAYELSTTLGRLVQDMIAQQTRARGDVPVPAFSIAADTRTNSLIVSTTSAYFAIVEQLLENLDKEQPIRDVQYIALTNAQAVDVAEKVNALFTDRKGSDKPVIEAEEYTNSLTVIAKAVDLLTIQEMVEKLDKGRRELQVRVVPIKQIKAERMAEIIQRVYGQTTSSRVIVTGQSPPTRMGIELPAPQPTPAPPPPAGKGPAASAKPWTGSVPRPATQPATRPTTRPESAPAAKDDGELEENPPITIAIDHKSNTLIISGPPQEIDNIQGLIDQMMTSPEEAEAEFRTYRIEHADPVVLAQTLEDMFNPKPKVVYLQARTGQPAQAPAEPPPPITVQADARTRSIVVRAKVIDFDMIEPLIKYLDQETSAHSELRVFPLENTEAGEVADNLKEMFNLAQKGTAAQPAPQPQAGRTAQRGRADRVRQVMDLQVAAGGSAKVDPYSAISISANRNTNSVVVSAPKEVMKLVESIIQELDQSALQSKTVVRMYPLKHAEVTPTVSALREIFSQAARTSPLRSSRTGSTPGASLRDAPIVVTGDEVGRQIIVSAPVTQHETVAKVIQDIDTAQGVGQILVQVYRIQNAEATSVAASLSTMFSSTASAAGTGRRVRTATGGGGPRISADASSNCIVVRAVQEDHAEITRLLEELDASPADKYPVRRIPIQNASPTVLATNLRAVFAGRSGTAGGRRGGAAGRDGLVIQPDEDARMLLVRADEETYKKIEEMVQALDAVSVSDKLQTVIIPLEHGQATSVAAALSQAFGASARGGRRSTSPEDEVRIAAETFTNSILITASEKNLLKIQAMVQKLEKDTAGGVKSEFLVLTNAKADDLATVLARLAGASGRGARGAAGTGGVTVAADAAANALVFSGPAAEVAKLSTMAKQLDQAAQGSAVQVFMIPLKNNIASEVAAAIQQLHAQQAVRRGGAASREPLSVTFDDSANVVVLSTTKRQYDEISQWVTKFEELKVTREAPKIIALVNSDPQEIERALRQMFAGGSAPGGRGSRTVRTTGKVEIASLPQQRALLVKAGAEDFKLISDLVKSLDESAPTAMPKQTMVALKHAPAASVASALTAAFGPGRRGRTALARPEDEVRVVAEAASNSVIITADEKNTTAVLSLIAKLDTDEASGKAQFLILKKAKAVELARVLSAATSRGARKPGQQPLVVTADAASNALVLSGPPNDIEAAIAMATKLDEAATAGISEVFLIPLKTGQASEVAATVQQIYQQQAAATRSAGRTIDPLAVSADDSANVIILATTKVMHDQVNQWIGKVEEMKVGQGEPRLVTLENADVAEVEKAVRALFITVRATAGRGARGAAGATGARIEVASLPQQRALLIKSGEEDFKAINDLIMALDAAAVTRLNKQTIIPLKHAQATSVAPALQSAFQQQIRGRGAAVKPEDEVRIIAEPISNTLIVAASDKNTVLVQGLVAKLDTDEASGKAQFLILQKAKAVELAKVLSTVSASRSRKPGQQPLIITADVASNALVMSGSATEMDAAIKMAQELDGAASESLAQVFLITLKSGQASDVAATVQQIYQQQTAAARTAGRSIDPLAVSADDSANVLILSTTKAMHDQVNQWVQKVEEMKLNQEAPQLVTLENADVQEVEKAIRQIFVSGKVSRTGKAIGKIELAVLPQQRALLIKAGEEDFKAINELIKSLDAAAVAAKHQQTLITLKHATAASVATALTTAFGPASRGRGVTIKPEDEVRVIAEPISNTVIVVASEKNTALVQGLVAKLDTDEASGKAQFLILKKAKAVELARVLSTANSAKARKPGQQPLVITADAASNALVLSGPSNDIEAAIVMATKLDEAATAGVSEVFLIPLKTGQASEVAATVQQIYQQQAAATRSAGRTIDPLAVSADDSANVIILATTKVMHDQVNQWIGKVEEMKVGQGEPRLVTLENADVAEVEKAVRALFITARAAGGRGARGAAGATGARIEVASLPQQRALLIKSSEEDFKAISSLILSLDAAAMEAKHQQTLITLKHATAASVATALTTAFGPVSRGRGATIKPEDEVRVIAEPISNTVIVVASEKNTTLVRGLVAKLDTDEASGKAQFLILKKAKAVELARVLSTANSAKARKPGQQPLVITADAASNALVLSGPSNDIEAAIAMATKLDEAATADMGEIFLLPLKNGQAAETAAMVQQLYQQQVTAARAAGRTLDPLAVSHDASANTIVLSTTKAMFEQVSQWVGKVEELKLGREKPHLIRLTKASCTEVEQAIRMAFLSGSTPRTGTGRGRTGMTGGPAKIELAALPNQQAILVKASEEDCKAIDELVKLLDVESPVDRAERTVIPLQYAQAGAVATALSQALTPPRGTTVPPDQEIKIAAEPTSNFLIVTANKDNQAKVQALLKQIDVDTLGAKVQFILLKQAKAVDLATVLQTAARRKTKAGTPQVSIAAEPSSNALVLSGPANELTELAAMVEKLDKAARAADSRVYILPLANGDAASVSLMIQRLYTQQAAAATRERKSIDSLAVTADDRANAIILATTPPMFAEVSQWVKQIEEMKPARGQLKMITLEHADPVEVEKAIQQLFESKPILTPRGARAPRGAGAPATAGTGGKVETTVLPQQKSILMSASEEDFKIIAELAKALDAAAAGQKRQLQVFTLKKANNARIATALNTAFAALKSARPEDQVTVTALAQTNSLVVAANKERMAEVKKLIEELDQGDVSQPLEFRVYPLANALPSKILPPMTQLLMQIKATRPDEVINVTADERTRSIIVTARGAMFDEVEKVIKTLDKPAVWGPAGAPGGAIEVLVIPLKKADAPRLANVLNAMLRPAAANQVSAEARELQEQIRLLRVRGGLAEQVPELDLNKPIKIFSDPEQSGQQGSNSLIISSTADNLKAMRAVVEILDTVPLADDVRVRILRLKVADATSVMQILRQMFAQGAAEHKGRPKSSVVGTAEPESVSGKALTSPLAMSVDVRTNTLILSGQEESLALAELIVQDLDKVEGKIVTEVRAFRLKHADAARVLPMLTATFAESATAVPGSEGFKTQVTRLRTVLEVGPNGKKVLKPGSTSEQAKTRPPLSIQADPATNILLVAAREDLMPLIADVINTLDVPGAGAMHVVRIFPLENADATRVQTVIATLYTGPAATLVRPEDKPNVAVDTRTNALVICASEQTFAMVEVLIMRLDAKQAVEVREIQIIPLKTAEAATLATTLQRMMDNRVQRQTQLGAKDAESLRMVIVADVRSNSLLVGGATEGFKLVKELAEHLDSASPALAGQIQIFPLKEANPATLATTLNSLFDQRYQAARTPDVQRQKPILLPDFRTNALLVVANADDSKILQGLLTRMDVKMTDPAVQIYVLPLKHNDAASVGATIRTIFQARLAAMTGGATATAQDRVEVAIDALSNSLVVSASRDNYALLVDLLKKVDIEPPMESGVVRMYPLAHADAARVAALLQSLIQQGLYRPGMSGTTASAALAAREKVSIVTDVRMNLLVISASKENFAVIDELIRKLDGADQAAEDMRVYPLRNADATRLASTLGQLFAARSVSGTPMSRVNVTFVPDSRTNTLIVTGSRESFGTVEEMIRKLDAGQGTPASEFRIFQLKQATATAIQPTVQQLFAQRVIRGTTRDPVTVLADARSNSLIVSATMEDMALAESLIGRLDVAPTQEGKTHFFPLVKADATQVANTIRNLYQGQSGAPAGAGVSITVDERINAIIVSAGEADLKRIRELIEQLDSETVTKVTEIRVFTLRNADATELSTILTDAMTNKPKAVTPGSPNRQTLLQFVGRTKEGKDLRASALQEGILITPDRRTNSLVVSAPIENMPLLDSLIQALDSTGDQLAEIRVFNLQNADCRAMATVLQELFRLQSTGSQGLRTVNYTMSTTRPAKEGEPPMATLGSAESSMLNVTVDARTNSLLISGCRTYVALCSSVIEELDSSPAQERHTKIYRLRNAKASDIQTALRTFLDQERQKVVQMLGQQAAGSAQRLLEHEIAVVAEATSNTLLLSASPRYFQTVADIIDELDQPQPQVLIQTLLAEVTLDDTTDLGFDFHYANTFHDQRVRTQDDGTQALVREVDRVVGAGTNFGTQGAIEKLGGFSVAITGGDISLFLRALQSQGRMEILSRPQILASDNQEATINVGQRVPFVTNTRISDQGSVFNTITYQDVGIMLRVTPRINPDGFVKLEVNPEISSLSTSSVQISEGLNAPVINSRSAQTTVMVQDGHTIVIGGLITTRDENRESKVPFLGDVPLLNYLFKSETKIKERTELLIILTPHVLRFPQDADDMTDKQLKRLNLLRESQKDALKEYLFKPGDAPTTRPATRSKVISLDSPFAPKDPGMDSVFQPSTQPQSAPSGGGLRSVGVPATQPVKRD